MNINEARKHGRDMLALTDILDRQFRAYRAEHRQKGTLSRGEVETCNDGGWWPFKTGDNFLRRAKLV